VRPSTRISPRPADCGMLVSIDWKSPLSLPLQQLLIAFILCCNDDLKQ
jgi:hypothetical protein